MLPYIFMERKGIHIIDLNRTSECLDKSVFAAKQIVKSGKKSFSLLPKSKLKTSLQKARSVGMPYVTERWLGGMMTNFATIRRSVKKMQNIDRMLNDTTLTSITKRKIDPHS